MKEVVKKEKIIVLYDKKYIFNNYIPIDIKFMRVFYI